MPKEEQRKMKNRSFFIWEMYLYTFKEKKPFSQTGPNHPCTQMQDPALHIPPFSHGYLQKSETNINFK